MFKLRSIEELLQCVNNGTLGIIALDVAKYGGGPIYYRDCPKGKYQSKQTAVEVEGCCNVEFLPHQRCLLPFIRRCYGDSRGRGWKHMGWNTR